ncbi:LON peptidase N-terminal domain and RING finger protein 3 isoform X1 [Fundulus heteroclitus]|uniref:LON peptidase N-terminal domain and RING finger protein 3 isoform X1 n=1 Tax=Fundulus heteroclitus TaxID=8078 RepID=UPI00165CC8E0|nr:LON peptidase N-terminal domain and RING finger protein 3 isoform X1 [Fundulus heteroclitus]
MGTEWDGMLRLAAEAFRASNFELAADIYECQLACVGDPESRRELMVKRADALAFGGKVAEAFEVYRRASEIERLQPAHLSNLVDYLSDSIRRQERAGGRRRTGAERGGLEDFSCGMCLGFLSEPVTLPCGHCFCKSCLEREREEKERPGTCGECRASLGVADPHAYRVNVVLSSLLVKWFPALHRAERLRREGNGLYAERKMEAALEKYNQAILTAPTDHVLFSGRSQIHSSLKQHERALRDAETACRLMPLWSKVGRAPLSHEGLFIRSRLEQEVTGCLLRQGHVRKAQALVSLGRTEDALREYLICLSIEPECRLAKAEAHKLLSDFLAPVTDQVPQHVSDCTNFLSSRAHVKTSIAEPVQTIRPGSPSSEPPPAAPGRSGWSFGKTESHPLKRNHRSAEEEEEPREEISPQKKLKREPTQGRDPLGSVSSDVLDPTDLECSLCMRLFYEPVTTPCGHTFCLQCLERCLDHNPKCPLCKEELSEYLVQRQYCKTVLMESLISKYLPSAFLERQKIHKEEMAELSNLNKSVPIFVCTMAFPTVPCPLHIFEPCYRLMIRRCMETGTNCFGMCLGDDLKGFAGYGCLLEIRDVKFFSDGRSVVDTIGRRRFKIIQHHERDGYNTADIEYLEDVKVEGRAERELQSLHDAVYDQALVWVNSLKAEQKQRIEGHFGPMPKKDPELQASPNGPSWCWWLVAVLPLEGRAQLPFLALTSLKDRLSGIRKVLLFMSQCRPR